MDKNLIGLSSVEDFINYGKNLSLSSESLYLKNRIDNNIIMRTKFVLDEYWDFITPYIVNRKLTEKEMHKYKYRPRTLCYDLYGNGELCTAILRLNNMTSALEFTKNNIKIFNSDIMQFIKEVLTLEKKRINKNRKELNL